jgi:hypothetical protein
LPRDGEEASRDKKDCGGVKMRKIDWSLVLLIIGFVLLSLVFFLKPGSKETFSAFMNIVTIVIPFIAVIVGVFLIRTLGVRSLQGKTVLFLTIGFFCWGLADTIWTFLVQETVSVADIFYFLGYIFLMIGIFFGLKLSDPRMFKNPKKTSLLTGIIIVLILAYFYFYPFSWNSEVSFLENLTTTGYLIVDLLLVIPLVFLIYSLFSGVLASGWLFVGLGVLSTLAADLWYAKNYGTYSAGDLVDLLWYLGYFFFIYALVHFKRANDKLKESLLKKKQD